MAIGTVPSPSAERVADPTDREGATRVTVAVLGTLVGLAGIEHGIGEILQGSVVPDGLLIESWPNSPAMEVLSGEPAMTLIPDLLLTGVLAVAVGLAVAAWSIRFAPRRYGGLVLMGLSVLLLLVGGGLAPPVMGIAVGAVAARLDTARRRRVSRAGRALAVVWPWFLAGAVVGYIGLVPGVPLASGLGLDSEWLVIGLATFAFANFTLALMAAPAHDRLHPAESSGWRRP